MKFLVTQGFFDISGEGQLLEVDLESEKARLVLSLTPPEHLNVAGKGFTGATWWHNEGSTSLLVCGFCGVYRINPESWSCTGILHQPCMNDLHHVAIADDRIFVANTGMDAVDTFSFDGSFCGSYACQPSWLATARQQSETPARKDWKDLLFPGWSGRTINFERDAPKGSYYEARSSKATPFHQRIVRDFIHPNHLLPFEEQLLCTRLADRSVVDLFRFESVIDALPGHPHDGLVDGGMLWFTCVNGLIVGYRRTTKGSWKEERRIDIFSTGHTGWCRGLAMTPTHFIVGLTELRRKSGYQWCDRPIEGTETSVLCIDRNSERLSARVDLTNHTRHSKIYSILEWQ